MFDSAVVTAAAKTVLDDATVADMRTTLGAVAKAGDTMTGTLVLAADPVNDLDAATMHYVDAALGGGAIGFFDYTFNPSAYVPPPIAGNFRMNNADQTLATTMYFHEQTAPGNDATLMWSQVAVGSTMILQAKATSTRWQKYVITSIVDSGAYFTVGVTWQVGGSALTNARTGVIIRPTCSFARSADRRSALHAPRLNSDLGCCHHLDFGAVWRRRRRYLVQGALMVGHVYVKSGGAWVEPLNVYVKRSGAWVEPLEAYVKTAGVWQQFYPQPSVTPPFSPADLASLTAWFDGDEFTGTAGGTAIATWADQEGSNDATQGTAGDRPTVDATGLSSKAVINFDGAGDHFVLPNFVSGYSAGSGFFVTKINDDPTISGLGADGPPLGDFGTSALSSSDLYPFEDGNIYVGFGSTTRDVLGNPTTSLATWHIGNFNSAPSNWSYFLNGVSFYATGTNTVGFGTAPLIGRSATGGGGIRKLAGKIAEILIFNAVLSTPDRQKVEGYLAHRWGIASVLPSGHPYKAAPP